MNATEAREAEEVERLGLALGSRKREEVPGAAHCVWEGARLMACLRLWTSVGRRIRQRPSGLARCLSRRGNLPPQRREGGGPSLPAETVRAEASPGEGERSPGGRGAGRRLRPARRVAGSSISLFSNGIRSSGNRSNRDTSRHVARQLILNGTSTERQAYCRLFVRICNASAGSLADGNKTCTLASLRPRAAHEIRSERYPCHRQI